jgi:hypothetical protein
VSETWVFSQSAGEKIFTKGWILVFEIVQWQILLGMALNIQIPERVENFLIR